MKKITMLIAVLAMLGNNAAFAADNMGKGAAAGSNSGSHNGMAWAVGLGTLAVLGTVVGLSASSAANKPSTFSH